LRSAHVTLNHAPNGLGRARLGLVVGRRMVKRAVGRNLIKRIAREAFRSVGPRLGALDVVLRVSKPMAEIERRRLRLEIDGLLGRLAR
jgi:ribonuclease P protein component